MLREKGLPSRPVDLPLVERRAGPGRERGGDYPTTRGDDLREALLVLGARDGPASELLRSLAWMADERRDVVGSRTQCVVKAAVEIVLNAQIDEHSRRGEHQQQRRGEARREPRPDRQPAHDHPSWRSLYPPPRTVSMLCAPKGRSTFWRR